MVFLENFIIQIEIDKLFPNSIFDSSQVEQKFTSKWLTMNTEKKFQWIFFPQVVHHLVFKWIN